MHKNSQHCTPLNWQYWSRYNSGTIHLFWREKDEQLDFQHADKHILEYTPSLIALKCYLCSMKWRTHSNLMVSCDVVPCASCAQKRELIKLFFIRQAGRQVGGLAMTSHFRTTSQSRFFIYYKTCDEHVSMWAGHVDFGLSAHVLSTWILLL